MAKWTKTSIISSAVGLGVGAVIVGGIWYGTYLNHSIVAKVGNTTISRSKFQQEVEAASGTQTMDQLISNQLIRQGAQKYKISASKAEVQTALKSLESQNGISNQSELQQALSSSGLTMQQLNQSLQVQVLEQKLAERNVKVSNKAIQNYYNQNKSKFTPKGKKTPSPLSSVRNQVIQDYKLSQAEDPQTLLAGLAKQFPIQIVDQKYQSVKQSIENPVPSAIPSP